MDSAGHNLPLYLFFGDQQSLSPVKKIPLMYFKQQWNTKFNNWPTNHKAGNKTKKIKTSTDSIFSLPLTDF